MHLKCSFTVIHGLKKYCIDQNGSKDKHNESSQMDKMNANADLTIVAVSGKDASIGLS